MANKIETILLQGFPLLADREHEDVILRQAEWLAIHVNNVVAHSQPDEIRVFETPYYEEVEDIACALEEAGFNVAACSTGLEMGVRNDYETGYEIRLSDRQSSRGLSVLVVDSRKEYLINSLKYIARIECTIRAASFLSPVLIARVDDADLRYVNDIVKELRAADYKAYKVQGGEEIEVGPARAAGSAGCSAGDGARRSSAAAQPAAAGRRTAAPPPSSTVSCASADAAAAAGSPHASSLAAAGPRRGLCRGLAGPAAESPAPGRLPAPAAASAGARQRLAGGAAPAHEPPAGQPAPGLWPPAQVGAASRAACSPAPGPPLCAAVAGGAGAAVAGGPGPAGMRQEEEGARGPAPERPGCCSPPTAAPLNHGASAHHTPARTSPYGGGSPQSRPPAPQPTAPAPPTPPPGPPLRYKHHLKKPGRQLRPALAAPHLPSPRAEPRQAKCQATPPPPPPPPPRRQIERATFKYESEYLELEEAMLSKPLSEQPHQVDIGISHADEPMAAFIAWLLLKQGYDVEDVYRCERL
jgi:hypothetical protein